MFIEVCVHPEKASTVLAICDIQSVHPHTPPAWKAPDINDQDGFTLYGVTYTRTKAPGRVPFWNASAPEGRLIEHPSFGMPVPVEAVGDISYAHAVPLFDKWLALNAETLQQRHEANQFRGSIIRLRNGETLPVAHAYEDLVAALSPIRVSVLS